MHFREGLNRKKKCLKIHTLSGLGLELDLDS